MEKLEGVGVMHWGGYDGNHNNKRLLSLADNIDFSNHKWRLGVCCLNPGCPNSQNVTLI